MPKSLSDPCKLPVVGGVLVCEKDCPWWGGDMGDRVIRMALAQFVLTP